MKKKEKNKKKIGMVILALFLFTSLVYSLVISPMVNPTIEYIDVSLPQLYEMIENNEVKEVLLESSHLTVLGNSETERYTLANPNDPSFKRELMELGVTVIEKEDTSSLYSSIITVAIYGGMCFFFLRVLKNFQTQGMNSGMNGLNGGMKTNSKVEKVNGKQSEAKQKKRKNVQFKEIAGVEEAKEQVLEYVDFLKNPKKYQMLGISNISGLMLYGPPGTGKTLLAKAIATEARVPFFPMCGSDFTEKFVGVGASRVREIFTLARQNAPSVIFIDEIDVICKTRSSGGSGSLDEKDQTLTALLSEMDGLETNEGVLVIGATNLFHSLDPAVIRPGRFERHVEVSLPDVKGREQILKVHGMKKPLDSSVDFSRLSKMTSGFSGAQLAGVLNEAAWSAARNKRQVITWEDIDIAYGQIIAGSTKKNNILTDTDKLTVAYHESGHAILMHLLAKRKIQKITILPSSQALGYVMPEMSDEVLSSKKYLFNEICTLLAGRLSEELFFGTDNITTGASNDFKKATRTAYKMVSVYGMSELGIISFHSDPGDRKLDLSEDVKNKAFEEVQKILKEAEDFTRAFLLENKHLIELLAQTLLDKENIDGYELDNILFPMAKYEQVCLELPQGEVAIIGNCGIADEEIVSFTKQ